MVLEEVHAVAVEEAEPGPGADHMVQRKGVGAAAADEWGLAAAAAAQGVGCALGHLMSSGSKTRVAHTDSAHCLPT